MRDARHDANPPRRTTVALAAVLAAALSAVAALSPASGRRAANWQTARARADGGAAQFSSEPHFVAAGPAKLHVDSIDWVGDFLLAPSTGEGVAVAAVDPMQARSAFTVATVWGSTPSGSQGSDKRAGIPEQFIGAWRLVSLEVADADGKVHRGDSTGMFVFTREGRLAVQVMDRTPPAAPQAGPEPYARGGYEATFGRFEVDERTHTFTYYVEGSLVRTLVGKALPRVYEFKGNQLIVKSANPAERWRAVWEHH